MDINIDLFLKPSFIKISPITKDDKEIFEITIKKYLVNYFRTEKKKNFYKSKRYYKSSYINFYEKEYDLLPIGFLDNLQKVFNEKIPEKFGLNIFYRIKDLRKRKKIKIQEKDIDIGNIFPKYTLRDYQKKAIIKFFSVANGMGLLEGSVACGKTLIFAAVAKIINLPTLIIVDRKDLAHQGRKEFIKEYDFSSKEVGIIQGKNILEKKFNFVTIQSLKKVSNWDNYKALIIDEVHCACANSFQEMLMASQAVYRLGVSGTITGLDIEDYLKIKAYMGDVYYRIPTKELVEREVLAEPKLYLFKIEKPQIPEWELENDWRLIEEKLIIENEKRNKLIAEISRKFPKPLLILVSRIDHGFNLQKMIKGSFFLYGKSDEKIRNIYRNKIDKGQEIVVIATNIWNKGINLRLLKTLIIAGGMKSFVLVKQRAGRGLRKVKGLKEDVIIVDFMDETHKILKRQFKKRLNIYEKDGFKVVGVYKNINDLISF